MDRSTMSLPRQKALREGLPAAADALQRRAAREIPADLIDDYVALNWLEWWGGGLRLTMVGQNVCRQLRLGVE